MTVHGWADLTRDSLGALLPEAVVVLPIGATEQHGPHLPTGTDALVVEAVVHAAARAAGAARDVVLTPTFGFGASDHHFPFGATLSLRTETMTEVLVDVARSVRVAGAKRLLVVNGHGGNRGPSHSAAQRAAVADDLRVACVDYWELRREPDSSPVPGHAGAFEGSLVAHLRPDLVCDPPDRPGQPAQAASQDVTVHERGAWRRIDGFTDNPAGADEAAGKRRFDACVAGLADLIARLANT